MADKEKVIIFAALTGAGTLKAKCPALPTTPEEIAEDAYQCWKAGAAVVHLHMRDDDTMPTMDPEKYVQTVTLLREKYPDCDVVINCTSSGTVKPIPDEARYAHFYRPEIRDLIEMGSFDAGTMNWNYGSIFNNNPQLLEALAKCYKECDVVPEYEIFDTGMIDNVNHLIKTGQVDPNIFCQIVLGVGGGSQNTVENLFHLVQNLPPTAKWSAFGCGSGQLPIMYAALAMGADGIRVGLEDAIWYGKGVPATNPMFVERAVRVIKEFGKRPATPAEAREILGVKPLVR